MTVRFIDVTEAMGLAEVHRELSLECLPGYGAACGALYMTGGAATGDYDGDGWPDLYVTRHDRPDSLYRNVEGRRFEDVTAEAGLDLDLPSNGAAWADIDQDGDLDLAVGTVGGEGLHLFVNDGSGAFREEAEIRAASLADGNLHFTFSLCFSDWNHDGWPDLHVTEWRPRMGDSSSHARLLRGRGVEAPGHFEDVTDAAGVSLDGVPALREGTWAFTSSGADLDADGALDLVVASDFGASRLFWGSASGAFTDGTEEAGVGTAENAMGSAIGDYDGDGDLDWFVSSIYDATRSCSACEWGFSGNRLYENRGGRRFEDVTDEAGVRDGGWGWGAAFFDFDNDGDLDLAQANGMTFGSTAPFADDRTRLFRNDGGTFQDVAAELGVDDPSSGRGLIVLDYDRDGDLDLFVANHASTPRLYRNDGAEAHRSLRVRSRGITPARVTVVTSGSARPMVREVPSSCQFLGQSEPVAHFGLGHAGEVTEVRVRWPGRPDELVLRDVPADGRIELTPP